MWLSGLKRWLAKLLNFLKISQVRTLSFTSRENSLMVKILACRVNNIGSIPIFLVLFSIDVFYIRNCSKIF